MICKALQSDIEAKLNEIDPVGARLRKLKRRLASLERKGTISANEYKEVSSGALKIRDLERQRKDFVSFESALDKELAKLLRISNNYDKLTLQYEAGKVDEELYCDSIRKLHHRLYAPSNRSVAIKVRRQQQAPLGYTVAATLEQAFAALVLIVVVIPALYACTAH